MAEPSVLRELQALDRAAADARSLLRRAARFADHLDDIESSRIGQLAAELTAAAEQLVAALEETRSERRARLRRQVLEDFSD